MGALRRGGACIESQMNIRIAKLPAILRSAHRCGLLCAAVFFSAALFTGVAFGQFQDPTPAELKMTTDPKAPGAPAVYLNLERDTDDAHNREIIYERIKILTEKGKELSTVRVPFTVGAIWVDDIQGRTIHSDGSIVPMEVKPEYLETARTKGFQENVAVFNLPSVEVGSIIEYRLTIGEATGKYFILPGLFFETRARHPFTAESSRATPIDVHFPVLQTDEVHYHLPAGYTVEGSPKSDNVKWAGFALLKINSSPEDGGLKVQRVFARNFTLLDPEKYSDLHDFYIKLATADQQQIVLVRPPAPKGN